MATIRFNDTAVESLGRALDRLAEIRNGARYRNSIGLARDMAALTAIAAEFRRWIETLVRARKNATKTKEVLNRQKELELRRERWKQVGYKGRGRPKGSKDRTSIYSTDAKPMRVNARQANQLKKYNQSKPKIKSTMDKLKAAMIKMSKSLVNAMRDPFFYFKLIVTIGNVIILLGLLRAILTPIVSIIPGTAAHRNRAQREQEELERRRQLRERQETYRNRGFETNAEMVETARLIQQEARRREQREQERMRNNPPRPNPPQPNPPSPTPSNTPYWGNRSSTERFGGLDY